MTRVPDLPELTDLANDDILLVTDVSDSTDHPDGSSKFITADKLTSSAGNVLKYGADPTGVADSTSAFQSAIDNSTSIYVPVGNFRIDGTIVVDKASVWNFERGILPNYRWHTNPTQEPDWSRTKAGCRLFKDNDSDNSPFFKIRSGWVFLQGFPLLDVGLRSSFTSDGVLYALGEPNGIVDERTEFSWPSIWGGRLELSALGNGDTISQLGEGMHVVRVDWGDGSDPSADNSYTTKLEWDILAQKVDILVDIGPKNQGDGEFDQATGQWSNSGFVNLGSHGAKRSLRNEATNGLVITGYHQADYVLNEAERDFPCLYFGSVVTNHWDFDFHDFGGDYKATRDGWRIKTTVEDYSYSSRIKQYDEERPSEIERRGLKVRNQRKSDDKTQGIVDTAINNNISNISLRTARLGGSFSWAVYKGLNIGGDTVVTDCVFANQSDGFVDIQSAGGNLPSWSVGSRFTVSDHSEEYNNAEFIVTAVTTDTENYTCEKIQKTGFFWNPVSSGSESVTITEDIGSLLQDSVTEGVAVSSDYTIPGGSDPSLLTHSWANDWISFEFDQQAVDDEAYIEYHFDGYTYSADRAVIAFQSRTSFSKIQIIRYGNVSSDVVDNVIHEPPSRYGNATHPPYVVDIDLSGQDARETIIRFYGPKEADQALNLTDLAMLTNEYVKDQHFVTQKGYHNVLGPMSVENHFQLPTSTTTELDDVTDAVNTSSWKVQGTVVYNTTTDRPVYATGSSDGDVWVDAAGNTAHTPT